jgi:hypothetical protein
MIALFVYLIIAIVIGCFLGRKLRKIFVPDKFKADWYGFSTNQLAHFTIGAFLVLLQMNIHLWITGEFFDRLCAFIVILVGYTCFEYCQKGKTSDIIEDILFLVFFGAGSMLYVFKWFYGSYVCGYSNEFLPIFYAMALVLIYGIFRRVKYAKFIANI